MQPLFYFQSLSKYHSHINTARELLRQYQGEEPFAIFSKRYFAANKKYGSRDRRQISHLCYCYFRANRGMSQFSEDEKLLAALFVSSQQSNELLGDLAPEWNARVGLPTLDKMGLLPHPFAIDELFPAVDELSDGIEANAFGLSHLVQPDLFLRLRPGKEDKVRSQLLSNSIPFENRGPGCIALPNSSRVDQLIALDQDAIIQDESSQRVGDILRLLLRDGNPSLWDCCAASGGKSILAYDILPSIRLTVSDLRESILSNLRKRFETAGIRKYDSQLIDLGKPNAAFPISWRKDGRKFDIIIADVPCSGSGTWGRTPEQLSLFSKEKMDHYTNLQRRIIGNAITRLKTGGHLVYITCSVFRKENEEMIHVIQEAHGLELLEQTVIKGYDRKADTMFAALLRQPS